ncbi:MAG: hypothetical protein FJ098_09445 [Deltaproteobacteria bacterium]|nr:hypothetical protein [Deltaproteobacteria bacterium]
MRTSLILLLALWGCDRPPAPPPQPPAEAGPSAPVAAPPGAAAAGADMAVTPPAPAGNREPAARPAPFLRSPTLPVSSGAGPLRVNLPGGAALTLPRGAREIRMEPAAAGKPEVRHYFLNHPMGRGLRILVYPLEGRSCDALVAAREAAFQAGAGNRDAAFLERFAFHRGARCQVAGAACFFSDSSRRSREEVAKGARFHREAVYFLCTGETAVSLAWKVPDGAEVTDEVVSALTAIAETLTVP